MKVLEKVSLAAYTTLGVGGPARWFVTAETEGDVVEAIQFARERDLQLFVLGGGSNLLVSDEGFAGLVLHMAIRGVERDGDVLRAGAGEIWDGLVQVSVDAQLQGIECLAGIPGTVGGTPVQNVGAYGQEISETILAVRAFDLERGEFVEMAKEELGFAYRTSVLNTVWKSRFVVTRVDFRLFPVGVPCLKYADLKKHFGEGAAPTLGEVAEAVRKIRRAKSMVIDPADPNSRSAGSFFRNPVVAETLLGPIARATGVETVPHWPAGEGMVKLPAAWLLERAGFVKGFTLGRAGISTNHTLAVVNRGGATAADVLALQDLIVRTVREKFGVELEREPVWVDFVPSPTPLA